MQTVWRSADPHDSAWHATRAEGRRHPVVLEWHGYEPHRVAPRGSAQAVLTWMRDFAKDCYETLEPAGRTVVQELDEMWRYLMNKPRFKG
jgi:hypothetical protein